MTQSNTNRRTRRARLDAQSSDIRHPYASDWSILQSLESLERRDRRGRGEARARGRREARVRDASRWACTRSREDDRTRHGRRDDDGGVRRWRRRGHRRRRRRRRAPGVARVVPELGPGQPSVRVHVCVFVDFVFGATAAAVEAFLGIQGGRRTGDVGFRARDAGFGAGWRTSGASGARLRRR